MKYNVVITIFDVESEAFQAFNDLCMFSYGEGYDVYEAGLIKNKNNTITLYDGFSTVPTDSQTEKGLVIGSLVGIIGGPLGVLLGANTGAKLGLAKDTAFAMDTASVVAVVANKIYEGETAIIALVAEDEPAFDTLFENYATTIVRYDAADIAEDVDRLYELEDEISNQIVERLKADQKAERQALREERRAENRAAFEATLAARDKTISETNKIVMNLRPI